MNVAFGTMLWLFAATQSPAGAHSQPPPDLEVVGRLENLNYEAIDDPEDLLGHGWVTARLHISRVVQGRAPSRLITIRYLAHTYLTESSPVRLKLRRNTIGIYTVCAARGGNGLVCG